MAFDGGVRRCPAPRIRELCRGQAAISRALAYQNTPERLLLPTPLSGTAGPAVCGKTGMVGPDSEPLDRGALGRRCNSVRANRSDGNC